MLGFFPSAYSDELLYSLCARYSDRVQYPSDGATNLELFGSYFRWGNIGFPGRLNHLVSALPTGLSYSAEDFIYNNTLFPFYAPFFPTERVSRLLKVMKGSTDAVKQSLAGTFNSSIKPSPRLRFCPACMEKEINNYGERYWHRLHQAPGVEVCPDHLNFLESSDFPSNSQRDAQRYVSAAHLSSFATPKCLDSTDCTHQALLRIARDVQWLLAQRELAVDFDSLHICYVDVLAEQNLTHYNSSVKLSKLHEEFQTFYPSQLLSLLQCQINKQKTSNWLSNFLPYLNRGISSHPLRHLLFIQFLGLTAESFFNRCKLEVPSKLAATLLKTSFSAERWLCLNPTCDYFRQQPAEDCRVTYSNQGKTFYGTFQCSCGFSYKRKAPITGEDRFRVGVVKAYGHVWESALKEFWDNPYFTLKDIALELGVYHKTVKYQALHLGLSFPRPGPGRPSTQVSPKHQKRIEKAQPPRPDKLKTFRSKWLINLKKNKGAARSVLRRNLIHVHWWLSKHDREWLESHLPPPRRNNGASVRLDWKSRDAQLAEEIRRITLHIMNTEGRPVRVTRSSIFRDRKQYQWLLSRKTASKLPLTIKALSEVVETRIQFSLRRIRWAADCFTRESVAPSFTRLAKRAGVADSISLPEVNTALESALLSLQRLDITDVVRVA